MACNKAPKGWECMRVEGHGGPCAVKKQPWYIRLLNAVGTVIGEAKFGG